MTLSALDTRAWAPFRRAYRAAVDGMRPAVDDVGLRRFAGGSVMRGLDELPWEAFGETLLPGWERSAARTLQHHRDTEITVHRAAVLRSAEVTGLADLLAVDWLERRGLTLATHLTAKARAALTDALRDAVLNKRSLEQVINQASLSVGLHPQDRAALRALRERQVKAGATPRQVEQRAERYRVRLVRQRAELIAQTELVTARTAGTQQAWRILQETGELGRQAGRRWVVGMCCPVCLEMAGQVALLGRPYVVRGGRPVMGPPLHPRCGCREELVRR